LDHAQSVNVRPPPALRGGHSCSGPGHCGCVSGASRLSSLFLTDNARSRSDRSSRGVRDPAQVLFLGHLSERQTACRRAFHCGALSADQFDVGLITLRVFPDFEGPTEALVCGLDHDLAVPQKPVSFTPDSAVACRKLSRSAAATTKRRCRSSIGTARSHCREALRV
jgi:hypothetical protein